MCTSRAQGWECNDGGERKPKTSQSRSIHVTLAVKAPPCRREVVFCLSFHCGGERENQVDAVAVVLDRGLKTLTDNVLYADAMVPCSKSQLSHEARGVSHPLSV